VNGKIYIGQSVNPERRFEEHMSLQGNATILTNAVRKYGRDCFEMEILERDVENYDDREIYWIKLYNSTDKHIGYNISTGGNSPPILRGDDSACTKFSDETISMIYDDLRNPDISFAQICDKHHITPEYLTLINRGVARHRTECSYPIRKNGNERHSKADVLWTINMLRWTTVPIEEIAREGPVSSVILWKINNGEHYWCPKDIQYPIRYPGTAISKDLLSQIYDDLRMCTEKMSELERKYNISHSQMSRINQGKILRQQGVSYPIRMSSNRVYKPVETIPSQIGSKAAIDTQLEMVFSSDEE
jgi:hypothetical protein